MAQSGKLKTLYQVEGIATAVLGAIALLVPPIIAPLAIILLGWLLMASGLIGLIATLRGRHGPGFWWALLSAIITIAVGAMLFAWPLGGLVSLSAALGLFLALDGVLAVGLALEHRRHMTPRWIWLLINGLADLLFAGIIVLWLPSSENMTIVILIGLDMMISGFTLIVLSADLGKARKGRFPGSAS